jgi:hypothetical protein
MDAAIRQTCGPVRVKLVNERFGENKPAVPLGKHDQVLGSHRGEAH